MSQCIFFRTSPPPLFSVACRQGSPSLHFCVPRHLDRDGSGPSKSDHPESSFSRDASSESKAAYLAHFPRSFSARYFRVRRQVLRSFLRLIDEGSGVRALAISIIKCTSPGGPPGTGHSFWVRTISLISHFRTTPSAPDLDSAVALVSRLDQLGGLRNFDGGSRGLGSF